MLHATLNMDIDRPNESLAYKRGFSRFIHHILITGDLLFLNLAFLLAYLLRFGNSPFSFSHDHFSSLMVVCNLAWIVLVYMLDIYAVPRVSNWETIIWNIIKALAVHAFLIALFILTIKAFYFSRIFLASYYGILSVLVFGWRMAFVFNMRAFRLQGHNIRNVVIVGVNAASNNIFQYFESDKSHGFNLMAVFGENPDDSGITRNIISEDYLYTYLGKKKVDEVYCSLPLTATEKIREIMSYCENNLIRFRYVPDFRALLYKKVDIEFYGMVPVLSVRSEPLENITKRFTKRVFDAVFSFSVLFFLFPIIFPLIALAIKVTSRGPVLFKQKRSGRDNATFYCYKFRTMQVNQTSELQQATKQDNRITPIGSFLRKTSLDELPQFFNVLMGEMSVVGPRPHMLKHTEEYKLSIDKFMIRHFVKPGITGWAQVNGFRGLTETPQKMIKRARYDVWYIENWSLFLDLRIIFMTVFNIFKGEKNAF